MWLVKWFVIYIGSVYIMYNIGNGCSYNLHDEYKMET